MQGKPLQARIVYPCILACAVSEFLPLPPEQAGTRTAEALHLPLACKLIHSTHSVQCHDQHGTRKRLISSNDKPSLHGASWWWPAGKERRQAGRLAVAAAANIHLLQQLVWRLTQVLELHSHAARR